MSQRRKPDTLARPPRVKHASLITCWRWRIAASSRPVPITCALQVGDAVFDGLGEVARTITGSGKLPLCLHGPARPAQNEWQHEHAFILPEDADNDGLIDHITVCAAMGLDPCARRLLVALSRIHTPHTGAIELMMERAGGADIAPASLVGPSGTWVSCTPYVASADSRGCAKETRKLVKYEIGKRVTGARLAAPPEEVSACEVADEFLEAHDFSLERANGKRLPRNATARFYQLKFEAPVSGPIALGWACHQGLGQFVPAPPLAK